MWPVLRKAWYEHDNRWFLIAEEAYHEALGSVPPELQTSDSFIMGEAIMHDRTYGPIYLACRRLQQSAYQARFMPLSEYRHIYFGDLPELDRELKNRLNHPTDPAADNR